MSKTRVEVVIGGTIYALQGEESPEHIQRVASLINEKLAEIEGNTISGHLTLEKKHVLMTINVADEYVKQEETLKARQAEIEQYKAENLALQDKIRELTLELAAMKLQHNGQQKKNEHAQRGR